MTDAMANALRDEVYRAIHVGPVQELADPARRPVVGRARKTG
jgi:hypothetical protein